MDIPSKRARLDNSPYMGSVPASNMYMPGYPNYSPSPGSTYMNPGMGGDTNDLAAMKYASNPAMVTAYDPASNLYHPMTSHSNVPMPTPSYSTTGANGATGYTARDYQNTNDSSVQSTTPTTEPTIKYEAPSPGCSVPNTTGYSDNISSYSMPSGAAGLGYNSRTSMLDMQQGRNSDEMAMKYSNNANSPLTNNVNSTPSAVSSLDMKYPVGGGSPLMKYPTNGGSPGIPKYHSNDSSALTMNRYHSPSNLLQSNYDSRNYSGTSGYGSNPSYLDPYSSRNYLHSRESLSANNMHSPYGYSTQTTMPGSGMENSWPATSGTPQYPSYSMWPNNEQQTFENSQALMASRGQFPFYKTPPNSMMSLDNSGFDPAMNSYGGMHGPGMAGMMDWKPRFPDYGFGKPRPGMIPGHPMKPGDPGFMDGFWPGEAHQMPQEIIPCYEGVDIIETFLQLEQQLSQALKCLRFTEPVSYIYNPLDYAWETHKKYVKKFLHGPVDVLFLGMNPGPFGMAQTGVPFGEVKLVQEWLGITGEIGKPAREHPKKPVWGFECPRNEVSGARFWGYLSKTCGKPEVFFRHCFVHNICPLTFMNENGKNLTPPDLPAAERRPLNQICGRFLCHTVRLLKVKIVVGVGKYAQERARVALEEAGIQGVRVETVMHPSPANPVANKGWNDIAQKQLDELGVLKYIVPPPTPELIQQQQQQQQQQSQQAPPPTQPPQHLQPNNGQSQPTS